MVRKFLACFALLFAALATPSTAALTSSSSAVLYPVNYDIAWQTGVELMNGMERAFTGSKDSRQIKSDPGPATKVKMGGGLVGENFYRTYYVITFASQENGTLVTISPKIERMGVRNGFASAQTIPYEDVTDKADPKLIAGRAAQAHANFQKVLDYVRSHK